MKQKVLDLMTALRKITVMVAQRLEPFVPAMRSKGRLAVGADADVTVFDAARVIDRATYEKPGAVLRRHPPRPGRWHVRRSERLLVPGVSPGRAIRVARR